ncbi:hypothetical protein [Xanthobacter versatilis]|uniref:hypothetical protein n=1 Tax=Xanthobacter autotrophicus (strain ATCC BAA-1158 / Py2) TaxID=78245 RepID=UPI00372B73F4
MRGFIFHKFQELETKPQASSNVSSKDRFGPGFLFSRSAAISRTFSNLAIRRSSATTVEAYDVGFECGVHCGRVFEAVHLGVGGMDGAAQVERGADVAGEPPDGVEYHYELLRLLLVLARSGLMLPARPHASACPAPSLI